MDVLKELQKKIETQIEINKELVDESEKLKSENAKLRELLKSAVEDLKICSFQPCNYCEVCKYGQSDDLCPFLMCTIGANDSEFYWRHADEAAEVLKSENT